MKFVYYDQTAKIMQTGKQAFNFPTATITPQGESLFSPIRSNHFNAPILFQFGVKLVAVASLVADHAFHQFIGKSTIQNIFNHNHFMRRRACHVKGGGKPAASATAMLSGALAAHGFTNGPFVPGQMFRQ